MNRPRFVQMPLYKWNIWEDQKNPEIFAGLGGRGGGESQNGVLKTLFQDLSSTGKKLKIPSTKNLF